MDKQPPKGGTKAARQQQRELGRLKFFYQHWTFKEISGWLGVSENTIGKWAKDDGWKDEKRSLTQSREQALLAAYKQLGEIDANIAGRPEGERFATKDERLSPRPAPRHYGNGSRQRCPRCDQCIAGLTELAARLRSHKGHRSQRPIRSIH